MFCRPKVVRIIGNHLIQQCVPYRFFALKMLIDPGLHKPERCAQFPNVCPRIAAGINHNLPAAQQPDSVVDGPLTESASGQNRRRKLMIDDELKGFFLCSFEIRREILNALRHVPRDCVVLLCRQHLLRNSIRKNKHIAFSAVVRSRKAADQRGHIIHSFHDFCYLSGTNIVTPPRRSQ